MNLNSIHNLDQRESPHFNILEVKDWQCTKQGARSVAAFLQPKKTTSPADHSVTCCLYPKDSEGHNYLYELSPQLGCTVDCSFCGCGDFVCNLGADEVVEQMEILEEEAQQRGVNLPENSQINFSDGGEILLNAECLEILRRVTLHQQSPVKISTTLPDTNLSRRNLVSILNASEHYEPRLKLQVSLFSTDPEIRQNASRIPLFSFQDLRALGEEAQRLHPDGRCITLTFTLTSDSHCDPSDIIAELPPDLFVIRLHPYKPNRIEGITTIPVERLRELENAFVTAGYFVICDEYDEFEAQQLIFGGTNAHST